MRRGLLLTALLLLLPACGDERLGVAETERPGRAVLALDRDTVTRELLPDGDVALTRSGLVEAGRDVIRSDGWRRAVATGVRPALWLDADDGVVVAIVSWGQPPTRD